MSDLLRVLKTGDEPHPDPRSRTRINEIELGIEPPRVYAYLGQALEAFGNCGMATSQNTFKGDISPFDSGGLIAYHQPICKWDSDARREFLKGYTWPHSQLNELLEKYPGSGASLETYLAGKRPDSGTGLHDIIKSLTAAELWTLNEHWRAWTWEGRCIGPYPPMDHIYRWTCPPHVYAELIKLAGETNDDDFVSLAGKYVRGGPSELALSLAGEQLHA